MMHVCIRPASLLSWPLIAHIARRPVSWDLTLYKPGLTLIAASRTIRRMPMARSSASTPTTMPYSPLKVIPLNEMLKPLFMIPLVPASNEPVRIFIVKELIMSVAMSAPDTGRATSDIARAADPLWVLTGA